MNRLLVVAVSLATVAACGGSDTNDADSDAATETVAATAADAGTATTGAVDTAVASGPTASSAPDAGGTSAAGPVTIEHAFGETTIDSVPERIVSLDPQWTDVLAAIGHPPVAAVSDFNAGGFYTWQQTDGVEEIQVTDQSIPFEAVAAASPDLIVGTYTIADRALYDRLTELAPTIPSLADGGIVDQWQDITTAAGAFLERPADADRVVATIDDLTADLRAELPGLEGKTYVMANYVPGDAIYVVADTDDGAARVFSELGLQLDPDILEMEGVESGRVSLSLERIGELDADLLVLFSNGADPSEIPGWAALPAVQSGAAAEIGYEEVVGLNTPSPLSLPYSLDIIRPQLEAAADSG